MSPFRPRASLKRLVAVALLLSLGLGDLRHAATVVAGSPPDAPVITSPLASDVGADDVHMEMGAPFRDPDGDAHAATDWEIRSEDGATVVWAAYNSAELVHAHFSDGTFQGPLAGQRRLSYGWTYLFRVRFLDSGGDWSAWSERRFVTARKVQTPAQQAIGVLAQPAPTWRADGDAPISLPAGARLAIEDGTGAALLTLSGGDSLTVTPGAFLAEPNVAAPPPDRAARRRARPPQLPVDGRPGQAHRRRAAANRLSAGRVGRPRRRPRAVGDRDGRDLLRRRRRRATRHASAWRATSSCPGRSSRATGWRRWPPRLQMPVSLAFVENPGTDPAAPRFYVTELYGRIKVVTNDGRVLNFADGLLNVNPTAIFPGSGELGVIGVCLPPGSRDVYATMVYRDPQTSLRNKVVRIRSADGLDGDAVEDILVPKPGQGLARSSHQIQQCSFGPDGKLYVFVGRRPRPGQRPGRPDLQRQGAAAQPGRQRPDRQPQVRPGQPDRPDLLPVHEGPAQRLRHGLAPGRRPALPDRERPERRPARPGRRPAATTAGTAPTRACATHALYNWPEPHWSPVGLTFVEGAAAAAIGRPDKQGQLLVAAAGLVYADGPQRAGKAIQEFALDAGWRDHRRRRRCSRATSARGSGSIADLKLQPDGLYFTDLYLDDGDGGPAAPGGKVWRIRYAGAPTSPPRPSPAPPR